MYQRDLSVRPGQSPFLLAFEGRQFGLRDQIEKAIGKQNPKRKRERFSKQYPASWVRSNKKMGSNTLLLNTLLAAEARQAIWMSHIYYPAKTEYAKLERPLAEAEMGVGYEYDDHNLSVAQEAGDAAAVGTHGRAE